MQRGWLFLLALGLTSCAAGTIGSPPIGFCFSNTASTVDLGRARAGKSGRACQTTILSIFTTGEASAIQAAREAGISEIRSVDEYMTSILFLYAKYCVEVFGETVALAPVPPAPGGVPSENSGFSLDGGGRVVASPAATAAKTATPRPAVPGASPSATGGFALDATSQQTPGPVAATKSRLAKGMTPAEVEATMGAPARKTSGGPSAIGNQRVSSWERWTWRRPEGTFSVLFADGLVMWYGYDKPSAAPTATPAPTPADGARFLDF